MLIAHIILVVALAPPAAAGDSECLTLGTVEGRDVTLLSEVLARPEAHDGASIVTEGYLSVEPGGDRFCVEGDHSTADCLYAGLDSASLGGSDQQIRTFLGQWYLRRVRIRGSILVPDQEGLVWPAVVTVSGVTLIGEPPEPLFCLDELDLMPPPESPHDYLGGTTRKLNRCAAALDHDDSGRLVCQDREHPWVWVETENGFQRIEYEDDPIGKGWAGKTFLALGEGRFALGLARFGAEGKPAPYRVLVWDGSRFVHVSEESLPLLTAKGQRFSIAEVDRDENQSAVRSRAYSVDSRGCKSLVWAQDGVEALLVIQLDSEVVIKFRAGAGHDEYVTIDLSEAGLGSAECD